MMDELIALQEPKEGEGISYAVKHSGKVQRDAVRLSPGAVRAFFDQTRKSNPGIADAAISVLLTSYVTGWVQNYDFASLPPVYIDAADMLRRHGISVVATWDGELESQTVLGSEVVPSAAVKYSTKIKAAGESRKIAIRVGYAAYMNLKERSSAPWDRLRKAVAAAFGKRLARPNYLPRDGEVIELPVVEVLEHE